MLDPLMTFLLGLLLGWLVGMPVGMGLYRRLLRSATGSDLTIENIARRARLERESLSRERVT